MRQFKILIGFREESGGASVDSLVTPNKKEGPNSSQVNTFDREYAMDSVRRIGAGQCYSDKWKGVFAKED